MNQVYFQKSILINKFKTRKVRYCQHGVLRSGAPPDNALIHQNPPSISLLELFHCKYRCIEMYQKGFKFVVQISIAASLEGASTHPNPRATRLKALENLCMNINIEYLLIQDVVLVRYNFILQMGAQNDRQQALQIRVYSGEAQSIQLFDFQSDKRQECEEVLQFPSKIAYSDENGIMYINDQHQDEVCEPIFDIKAQEYHKIVFQSLQELDFHNQVWRVINANQKFPLYEDDELKLGKIKIKLKSIVSSEKNHRTVHEKEQTEQMNISLNEMEELKNAQEPCRICFDANQTPENPLLSLCHCTGTVRNIHFQCLKDWITNSVQRHQSSHCLSYSYTEAKCQLCKKKYDNQFYHNGTKFMLYQFEKLQPPYALFENMNIDESMDKNRISVFMIKLEEGKEILVGRNASSEVILNDISVSRSHCLFMYEKGQLFIKDRKSKFGTLIRSPGSWEFEGKEGIQLQIGSKLIKIDQEKILDNCCCASKPYQFQLLYSSDGQL